MEVGLSGVYFGANNEDGGGGSDGVKEAFGVLLATTDYSGASYVNWFAIFSFPLCSIGFNVLD